MGANARAILLVIVAALLGACGQKPAATALPVLPVGGDFVLLGHDHSRFELASLRGKVVLVFFGYSSCPDACPTTLSKLATASRRLGDERGKVKTLYVSVDPERDTPDVLEADLKNFDLDALGLTGTKPEIDKVVNLFGAAYEIMPTPESAAKYTVAHTTWVYALDTRGRTRIMFPYEATVDQIVSGIRALLAEAASDAAVAQPVDEQARAVAHRLMSPYCHGLLLADCRSLGAQELRAEIRSRLLAGEKMEAVEEDIIARFGEAIRAEPKFEGVAMLLLLGPLAAGAAGIGLAWFAVRLVTSASALSNAVDAHPEDAAMNERLRDELDALT